MSPRRPLLVNADDLEQESDRYDAAAKLPLLVRRLVLGARSSAPSGLSTDDLDGWLEYTPAVHLWWTLAFIAATIQSEAEPRREALSANTVIVSAPSWPSIVP